MKVWGIIFAMLLIGAVARSQTAKNLGMRQGSRAYSASRSNEDAVIDHLRAALKSSGYAARIYYAGQCAGSGIEFVYFPKIKILRTTGGGLHAIESMFSRDSNVSISRGHGMLISIKIGQVPTTILQTKIPMFTLAPLGQYNPSVAIGSLLNTTEVRAEMARLRLRVPESLSGQLLAQPASGLPHLPSTMRDVTVDQVLDSVAITFQGVVVYGICPEPQKGHMYTVDFVGLEPGNE